MEEETTMSLRQLSVTGIIAIAIIVLLTGATILSFWYAKGRPGSIVIPAGNTYLGPSLTPVPPPPQTDRIQVPANDERALQTGKVFPFSFTYPKSLSLGVFPGDPFDSVTIFWGNTNPQENLLLRVENLKDIPNASEYLNKPKIEYARDWWKQYNWKGVDSVVQFTNSKGLTGYRAKYKDGRGAIPFDHVFFEVPNRPELVIWMSGKLLDQATFDAIVDSVSWQPN